MTAEIEIVTEEVETSWETTRKQIADYSRKLFLASLGVMGMAQDNLNDAWKSSQKFADKLVERGETFEEKNLRRARKQVEDQGEEIVDKAKTRFDETVETVINRLQLPTRNTITDLEKQIAALGRKIDRLRKEEKVEKPALA
ncbi:MAG: phasin family protein [Chloroflexi bacterium]|nr:phasin family protein [Chloroflexota bacterium]MBP8059368.1 phasin family protein [Chloroflexota bacterium]